MYFFFWRGCFCCDKVSACIFSAAFSNASSIAVPWGHEVSESQSLMLRGYKQPDFSAQENGSLLERLLSTSKCYPLMCLVDCTKEHAIQKEILYLASSILQAQWSLRLACIIVSSQEFRGWQACFFFQLKINWHLSHLSAPLCFQSKVLLLFLSDLLNTFSW